MKFTWTFYTITFYALEHQGGTVSVCYTRVVLNASTTSAIQVRIYGAWLPSLKLFQNFLKAPKVAPIHLLFEILRERFYVPYESGYSGVSTGLSQCYTGSALSVMILIRLQ